MFKAGFVVPLSLTVFVVFIYFAAIMYTAYKKCKNYLAKRKEGKKPNEHPAMELVEGPDPISNSEIEIDGLEEKESASPSSDQKKAQINKK